MMGTPTALWTCVILALIVAGMTVARWRRWGR
jgi:hypothetical protein